MKVKIDTEAVWEGERLGAGSVIEVSEEVHEANSKWMKKTDDELKKVPPAKEKKVPGES